MLVTADEPILVAQYEHSVGVIDNELSYRGTKLQTLLYIERGVNPGVERGHAGVGSLCRVGLSIRREHGPSAVSGISIKTFSPFLMA